MISRTLVLVKPDGIFRGLIGEIIKRFEQRGLKIIGLKMVIVDEEFARKHYTEDISKRRGEHVRNKLIKYIVNEPIVAICVEGVNAVENVRKLVGETEPSKAMPGTIRGDFAHVTFNYADTKNIAVKNLVHASGSKEEAITEVKLWFSEKELYNYKAVHDEHVF